MAATSTFVFALARPIFIKADVGVVLGCGQSVRPERGSAEPCANTRRWIAPRRAQQKSRVCVWPHCCCFVYRGAASLHTCSSLPSSHAEANECQSAERPRKRAPTTRDHCRFELVGSILVASCPTPIVFGDVMPLVVRWLVYIDSTAVLGRASSNMHSSAHDARYSLHAKRPPAVLLHFPASRALVYIKLRPTSADHGRRRLGRGVAL